MRMRNVNIPPGITILEIVIVVIIVGFIALVSLSRFPEGNVRAYASRTRSDLRTIADKLEAYRADHGRFPGMARMQASPSNPKALTEAGGDNLTTLPPGIFEGVIYDPLSKGRYGWPLAYYTDGEGWIVFGTGPDKKFDVYPEQHYSSSAPVGSQPMSSLTYDPTNGLLSSGDIILTRQMYLERKAAQRPRQQRP